MVFATRTTLFSLILLSLSRIAAMAALAPVGPEFAAEDRPIPAEGWWESCSDADGVRTTLVPECVDAGCSEPGHLIVERTDAAGNLLAPRLRITETAAVLTFFRVTCHAGGEVLVQWRDGEEGCFVHRRIDAEGAIVTEPKRTAAAKYDCRARPSVAVRADGTFLAAWAAAHLGGGSGVIVQAFDAAGDATTTPVWLTETVVGWNRQPKIAVDDRGTALVVWSGDSLGTGAEPVLARAVVVADASVEPLGDILRLDTFGFGTNAPPTVATEGEGEFTVIWSNPYQGGRVGRRVSAAGAASAARAPVPSAGSAPPERRSVLGVQSGSMTPGKAVEAMPAFGASRVVDSWPPAFVDLDAVGTTLADGPASSWLVGTAAGLHQITRDDGITWSAPSTASARGGAELAVAPASDGTVIAVVMGERADMLYFARSRDAGETWSKPALLAPVLPEDSACPSCTLRRVVVAASADAARWVAAWTVASTGSRAQDSAARIHAVFSNDGGKRWSRVRTIAENAGAGIGGFDLVSRTGATWLALWIDEDVRVAASRDGGASWSRATTIAESVSCTDCALARRFQRAQLAGDESGAWVAVFAAARFDTEIYGHDGDVFAVRSLDDGSSWSAPVAIAPYARTDGWRDFQPSVATDGAGRWLALWTSHRPVVPGDEMDPDVVMAVSMDAGLTWSDPVAARPDDNTERVLDWSPLVAARNGGEAWMLTWQRRGYGDAAATATEAVLAAAADAECGNRRVEVGEECDDGNLRDGDGCNSNCTRPRCGNGIVDAGEECDDGNRRDDDSCSSECVGPRCGDGVVQGDEECDDGNTDDDDECPSTCRYNRCGDGYVDAPVEECDDGNRSNHDACTNDCRLAYCGDGYVQDYVEACDDGNRIDDDECPNTCDRAVCGDGHTARGIEECDREDPMYREVCTDDCRTIDLCGDADGDGSVSISDVQRMLGRSVGLSVRCPREVCDMDGDGSVSALDARMGIRAAVGLDVGARCSIGTGNLVFWIDHAGDIGALQIEIDYSKTGGSFVGSGGAVECETVVNGVHDDWTEDGDPEAVGFAAFNDIEEQKVLKFAMISALGFSGPMDLFRCAFVLPEERSEGVRLVIRPEDATDPDFDPIVPPPLFGYRLE